MMTIKLKMRWVMKEVKCSSFILEQGKINDDPNGRMAAWAVSVEIDEPMSTWKPGNLNC
jgi:hypothetical protein